MRILTLTLAALAAMLAPATAQAQQLGDTIVNVASTDAAMNAAIAKGRQTLPDFFAHFAKPARGESGFLIKYDVIPEAGKAEFIWAEVISHAGGVSIARLVNTPRDPRFKLGEKVSVRDADIIDWGYWKDGVMQGQLTTRVLLPALDPAEADAIRKAFGW
jgi:uncharacterized protein YegJ (DUF2314 family)